MISLLLTSNQMSFSLLVGSILTDAISQSDHGRTLHTLQLELGTIPSGHDSVLMMGKSKGKSL